MEKIPGGEFRPHGPRRCMVNSIALGNKKKLRSIMAVGAEFWADCLFRTVGRILANLRLSVRTSVLPSPCENYVESLR